MRKEIVEYTDDLDGEPIDAGLAQTIRFTVDDIGYEIDLRPAHAERLRRDVARWIAAAHPTDTDPDPDPDPQCDAAATARTTRPAARDRYQLAAVRSWAKSRGIAVSARGPIRQQVLAQFDQAHAR